MRAGACAVPQTLTAEAASVLRHSLGLARRRGHAQVTPLHVAATLLGSRASPLRRACLRSQPHQPSHHHQCRALELCFNVALNRLPTAPSPLLSAPQATLSNALAAALKRAQAHQRRGCIEHHQPPLLAVKVELDQLVISILDDPSVSRVMREAGFSSTAVKNNLEDSSAAAVFQCYAPPSSGGVFSSPSSPSPGDGYDFFFPPRFLTPASFSPPKAAREDLRSVLEVLLRKKRRNTVIVGDHLSVTEGLVTEVMGKVETGEVPEELRSALFVRFQFSQVSLRFMKKVEVEACLSALKSKVDAIVSDGGAGAIIYLGDLKWTIQETSSSAETDILFSYSPVDHVVSEIRRLVSDYGSSRTKVWLMATANVQTYMRCQMRRPPLEIQWALQAVSVPSGGLGLSLHASSIIFPESTSPPEETKAAIPKEQDSLLTCEECVCNYEREAGLLRGAHFKDNLEGLKTKWGKICQGPSGMSCSSHTSVHPWWSSTPDLNANSRLKFSPPSPNPPRFRRQQSCHVDSSFGEPRLDSLRNSPGKEARICLAIGNSEFSDSEKMFSDKCRRIQENVPWLRDTIPSIVRTLVENESSKKESWLLIQGNDTIGKRRLARAIAESFFASADSVLHLVMDERDDGAHTHANALTGGGRLVVLVENVDLAGEHFIKLLSDRFEMGKSGDSGRREGGTARKIHILTTGDSHDEGGTRRHCSVVAMKLHVHQSSGAPNSDHKRKAEQESSIKNKSPRRDIPRLHGASRLDLNMRADEEGEFSPVSSDLTRETGRDPQGIPDSIENRYVFNSDSGGYAGIMGDVFLSKIKECFWEVHGGGKVDSFVVEHRVLEEIVLGCGSFLNGLFDKWVREVFQTSLKGVTIGGEGGGIGVELCFGGKEVEHLDNGFMGSGLPREIQISSTD